MASKLINILALVIFLSFPFNLFAYDFSAVNEDGVTIYYNKISDTECAVTDGRTVLYTGTIKIPARTTYNGKTLSVTTIDDYAFNYCESLTSLTLPNSITSIGYCPFWGCTSLTSITVDSANPNYTSLDGVLFNKVKTVLVCYPAGKQADKYTVPNSVTSIGTYAFVDCSSLTTINLPNSITFIGDRAFYDCTRLTSITLPNSLITLDYNVFENCVSLTSLSIPDSVTSIGAMAFFGCSSLISITLPDSITSIPFRTFRLCI